MKKIIATTLLCSSLLIASNYNYEITPMIGGGIPEGNLDLDNQKNYGISLGTNLKDNSTFDQIELGILRSTNTDYDNSTESTKITRFFTNLIKEYGLSSKTSLYALAGVGVEMFSNDLFDNDNALFGNYGLGIKYKLDDKFSLKADVRHLLTIDGNNSLLYTVGLGMAFGPKAKPMAKQEVMHEQMQEPMKKEIILSDKNQDDDMDGIVNSKDMCPNTAMGVLVNNEGCALNVNLNINFDSNSSKINDSYNNKLEQFANLLKKYPNVNAKIEAHTDATASESYNQKLSQKRADETIEALKNLGVNSTRLEAIGYGELKPIDTNKTKEGRANNRRVIAIIKK